MRRKLWSVVLAAVVFSVVGLPPSAWAADRGIIYSGQTRTASITPTTTDDWYFSGAAGDTVLIKAVDHNSTPKTMVVEVWQVIYPPVGDPYGEWRASSPGCAFLEYVLPENGNYFLKTFSSSCDAGYSGSYDVTLLNITSGPLTYTVPSPGDPDGGNVTSGWPVNASISPDGLSDMDAYQFQAKPGDTIRVKANIWGGSSGPDPMILLYNAYDQQWAWGCGTEFSETLPSYVPIGTYTVVFQNCYYNRDGGYDLTVYYPTAMGWLSSGATERRNMLPGVSHEWELHDSEFQAGDRVIVSLYDETAPAQLMKVELYNEIGQLEASNGSCGSLTPGLDVVLPGEGSFFLRVSNACGTDDGFYDVSLLNLTGGPLTSAPDPEGGALVVSPPGAPESYLPENGSLGIGDLDAYTFSGSTDDRVTIYAFGARISLYPAGGAAAASACDQLQHTLAVSDIHTIVLEACNPGSPLPYTLSVDHVSYVTEMGDIASGETRQGDIDSGMWHKWNFTAAGGDVMIVKSIIGGGAPDVMEIVTKDPNGLALPPGEGTFPCSSFQSPNQPLSQSFRVWQQGSYTLEVRSCEGTYTGTHQYYLTLLNTSGSLTSQAANGALEDPDGGVVLPGETVDPRWRSPFNPGRFNMHFWDLDAYQFYGEPGDRVIIKAYGINGNSFVAPRIALYPPKDALNPEQSLTPTTYDERQEVVLGYPGIHTIVLEEWGLSGDTYFQFTLEKLPGTFAFWDRTDPAAPPLAFDTDGGLVGSNTGDPPVSGQIQLQEDIDTYFFSTTADAETVTLAIPSSTQGLKVSVYPVDSNLRLFGGRLYYNSIPPSNDPNNCVYSGWSNQVTVPTKGLHAVVVESCGAAAVWGGTYQLAVTTPNTLALPVRNPQPDNGAGVSNGYSGSYLSWDQASLSDGYLVWFGEVDGPLALLNGSTPVPHTHPNTGCQSCHSGPTSVPIRASYPLPLAQMHGGTTYQWRVESSHSTEGTVLSPVWQFTLDCNPALSINPSSWDFGAVLAGTTYPASPTRTFTVWNVGTCVLDPRVATVPGGFTVVSDDCTSQPAGGHLQPDESCSITVAFEPTALGPYAGSLTFTGTQPAGDWFVDLQGSGFTRDLVVSELTNLPGAASFGAFSVTEKTENIGSVEFPVSITRYRLSTDATIDAGDLLLVEERFITTLAPGGSSSATVTLSVPAGTAAGAYYLGACADHYDSVVESDESNNCLASSTTIVIGPDLQVGSELGGDAVLPATPAADGTFNLAVTKVGNTGGIASGASVLRYRLSLDKKSHRSDPLLAESRDIPALNAGAEHTVPAPITLTLPAELGRGSYYVFACADELNAVAETNEANNCRYTKDTIKVEPDLRVSAVGNPQANGSPGETVTVSCTMENHGFSVSEASTTRFRIVSSGTIDSSRTLPGTLVTGTLVVPALEIGGTFTATATLTIPTSAPPGGPFYFAACADDTKSIVETNEANNCLVATGQITIKKADLVAATDTAPPSAGSYGTQFGVVDTTSNTSPDVGAGASTTSYRLSKDRTITTSDPPLTGTRSVPALGASGSSIGTAVTVTVPAGIAAGQYYLGVCADSASAVPEASEANNCSPSSSMAMITLSVPNLVVTSVSDNLGGGATVSVAAGQTFSVTDTTRNADTVATAAASVTRYRLSLDATITSADPTLTTTRPVPLLSAGTPSTGSVGVTIPTTLVPGDYYLAACADATNLVAESSETDNCTVNTAKRLSLSKPNLKVISVSHAAIIGTQGTSFPVTATVRNDGAIRAAVDTIVRYRLSLDTTITSADPLLTGTWSIGQLDPSEEYPVAPTTIPVTVAVPATMPAGVYNLYACADDTGLLPESNDAMADNCLKSSETVTIQRPDLTVDLQLPSPLPSYGAKDTEFELRAVTSNAILTADATVTRFRLSLDDKITSADPLLVGALNPATTGTLAVGTLAPAGSSTGTVRVRIPATVPQGTYRVAACADDTALVRESNETNNCDVSGPTEVIVVEKPDLVVASVSVVDPPSPPATLVVKAGDTLTIRDTTRNNGFAIAGAGTTTRYRLSLDAAITSADPLLTGTAGPPATTGTHAVPDLDIGDESTLDVVVTIPAAAPEAVLYLAACADDTSAVTEYDEKNNCRLAATKIDMRKPDLAVTSVSAPPAEGIVGDTFTVDDTVRNSGTATTGTPTVTVRYRLSTDTTISSSDPLLTGSRTLTGLGVNTDSPGTNTSLTIPAAVPAGTYWLAACADDLNTVSESNETNNCTRSTVRQILVRKPDLVVTALSAPPAERIVGETFTVDDTVRNDGNTGTGATAVMTTRYRLSLDTTITSSDPLLTGTRTMTNLGVGVPSAGTGTVLTIPLTMAGGTYWLAACADDLNKVNEAVETNNCYRNTTNQIVVKKPDLEVSGVSDVPYLRDDVYVGSTFAVSSSTTNMGDTAITVGTKTSYYLIPYMRSATAAVTAADIAVATVDVDPPLGAFPSASHNDSRTLTVPKNLPSDTPTPLAPYTEFDFFYLAACADTGKVVTEQSETNNCRVSMNWVQVKRPNLRMEQQSEPPATGALGEGFAVTGLVWNIDSSADVEPSTVSTVNWRLSLDTTVTSSDPTLLGTDDVSPLPMGIYEYVGATVTIPTNPAPAPGMYYLAGCADSGNVISERKEKDNCLLSTGKIAIGPDLRAQIISSPPTVTRGVSFNVTDRTTNYGEATTGMFRNNYRLSTDATVTTADPMLIGDRFITVGLNPTGQSGDYNQGWASVSVMSSFAPGNYYLGVCADSTNGVRESDETNNCIGVPITVQ